MKFVKILSFLLGVVVLYSSYLNLTVKSEFKIINGTFENLNVSNNVRKDKYSIKLYEFERYFYVSKIITEAFDYHKFRKVVKVGDELQIKIDNEIDLNLNSALIYGIKKETYEFINDKKRIEARKSNGILGLILGLIALGYSVYNKKTTPNTI